MSALQGGKSNFLALRERECQGLALRVYPVMTSEVVSPPYPVEAEWFLMSDYVVEALGVIVRVDPDALKTVVFLGALNNGIFTPLGTGFIGAIRHGAANGPILITANHVLDDLQGPDIWVRVMLKNGDVDTVRIAKKNRFTHDDESNDVAILPLPCDPSIYDYKAFEGNWAVYDAYIKNMGAPQVGDTVSTIGLYTAHHGTTRNMPVVRTGNIAAMPEEPVNTEHGYVSAYLVETRSIAGLSGSPVYLNPPMMKMVGNEIHHLSKPSNFPIGVMIGYHLVKSREDQIQVPQFQNEPLTERAKPSVDERNTGFGVVVPIERVFEMIESDDFKQEIDRAKQKLIARTGYRKASAPAPDQGSAENPNHKADFTALLDAAARKPKSGG